MSVTNRYWRLISTDPKAAKRVILAPRPQLSVEYQEVMSDEFLYNMLEEMGTIAAVYYRKADEFITPIPNSDSEQEAISDEENESESDSIDIFDDEDSQSEEEPVKSPVEEKEEQDLFDEIFK